MSLDLVDRGAVANETEERRRKREVVLAKSPPPTFFKLRAQMLQQGRSNQVVAKTDHLQLNLKVYAGGGENGLHNHSDEDHVHLILQGSAVFYGPRGEERHCGLYEGILLPKWARTDGLPVYRGKAAAPTGPAGRRWGDPGVEAAARTVGGHRER